MTNQQLVEDNAQRVYIHALVKVVVERSPSAQMLWTHVYRTAADDLLLLASDSHPKVEQFHLVSMEHKVRWFDITMDAFGRMDIIERFDGSSKVARQRFFRNGSFPGNCKKILPVTKLKNHTQTCCSLFFNLAWRRWFLVAIKISVHVNDRVMTECLVDVNLVVKVAVTDGIGILNLESDGVSRGVLASSVDGGTSALANLVQDGEIGVGPLLDTKIGKGAVGVVSHSVLAEGIEGNLLLFLDCERVDVGGSAGLGWRRGNSALELLFDKKRALEGILLQDDILLGLRGSDDARVGEIGARVFILIDGPKGLTLASSYHGHDF